MRNKSTARYSRGPLESNPGAKALITQGAANIPKTETTNKIVLNTPNTCWSNLSTAAFDLVSLYSDRMGTNACAKAPSANNLRKKLGILNATKKAS